ncbi:MAG: RNA polymerase subunit sigma-70 [bacterium]
MAEIPDPFTQLSRPLLGELKRHCYRMMGGMQDAEDCLQETLLRGWRDFASLRDSAAARAWLYQIATRVCLDALRHRKRRLTLFGPSLDEAEPGGRPWIEPYPTASDTDRQDNLRLAFVSLLHNLSPRARAVLLLHDGVGMTAAETATALAMTPNAARSALQRARAALPPTAPTSATAPVEAYLTAWNSGNVGALIDLLHQDIVMTMPPWQRSFHSRDEVANFMISVWPRYTGFRALPTEANGQPAVAVYAATSAEAFLPHSLHILSGTPTLTQIILYAPPLGARLIKEFGLPACLSGEARPA